MRKRYLVLVLAVLLAISVGLVGCNKSESASVKDSINGFAAAYNDGDTEKCTDYLVDVTDNTTKAQAQAILGMAKLAVESIEVVSIEEPKVDGTTATAKVTYKVTLPANLGGQTSESSPEITLTKKDGIWKFSLTSLLPTSG